MMQKHPPRACAPVRPGVIPFHVAAASLALLTALTLIAGCSERMRLNPLDNQAPEVNLQPARQPDKSPEGATHLVEWSGTDVDGRVDHYRVAINPRTLDDDDPAWSATNDRRRTLLAPRRAGLGAATRDRAGALERSDGRDFDLIAVQAVDDQGALSSPAVRAFFEDNVAPSVEITSPRPSALLTAIVPPTVRIRFTGVDPDGPTGEPAYYKYILLGPGSEFPIDVAITFPDSLRRFYAPAFDGWTVAPHKAGVGGEVTLTDLVPGQNYLFAVVAFDAEGAYSPVFSLNSNMLRMRAVFAETSGPRITLLMDVLNEEFYPAPPGRTVDVDYPADVPILIKWFALSVPGATSVEYRWVLDPQDLDKELKRPRAGNDIQHWRPWSPTLKSATVGPFPGGETHEFVIEARDDIGFQSRLTVRLHTITRTYDGDLLIVDDTRLLPDQMPAGESCTRPPVGTWPTAAELDTFLYARGGVPWRCYPAGTVSPPGLFAGYAYDTLGTRTGAADPTIPLEVLNRFRHVIWIVDGRSATFNRAPTDPAQPITALRYMCGPGRYNTLAAYVRGGGRLWLVGGGGALASTIQWNSFNNDVGGTTFSNAQGELVDGRLMYDFPHWRSEIKPVTVGGFIRRDLGRNPAWPGAPDYARLPVEMRAKSPATDPFPPNRFGQQQSLFYRTTFDIEFLSLANVISENGAAVMDTTYRLDTFQLPGTTAKRVCMTYYHGQESSPVVFTGFDVWSFTRADCQGLVDFVLQDVWGMTKTAPAEVLVNAAPRR